MCLSVFRLEGRLSCINQAGVVKAPAEVIGYVNMWNFEVVDSFNLLPANAQFSVMRSMILSLIFFR